MMEWSTLEVLEQAALELGLPVPKAIPSGTVQDGQMLAMLNSAGFELLYIYPWSYLSKEWTLALVPGQDTYVLPTDLAYILNQTSWNRTTNAAMGAAQSPQNWARLQSASASGVTRYRILGKELKVAPMPTHSEDISLEYISNRWVRQMNGTMITKTANGTDELLHDAWLLIKYTKYKFLSLKGINAENARVEFTGLLSMLLGKDRDAPALRLAGGPSSTLLGTHNVPEGFWIP